jgi:hypothetical protein
MFSASIATSRRERPPRQAASLPCPLETCVKVGNGGQRWAKVGKGRQRWAMVGNGGQRWAMVGKGGQRWAGWACKKQKRWLPQPTVGESLNFSTMRICPASRRERTQPAIGIGNAATAKKAVTTRVSASRDYIGTKLGAAQRRPGRQSQVRDGELHHHRAPLCDGFSVQVVYSGCSRTEIRRAGLEGIRH